MLVLKRHNWPGNVRELENAIGHAAIMSAGPVIDASDLPQYLLQSSSEIQPTQSSTIPSLLDQEKELVIDALKKSRSNQSEAARILDISRDKLRYKMKKYGLV
jgi:DNA-binding NtrC family response regulator